MKTIKTDIIPKSVTFVEIDAPKELDLKAICIFAATGFFLDTDTYWQHKKVLKPASVHTFDESGKLIQSEPWFQWYYSPREISFDQALQEFTELFEIIIEEQTANKKVILPLSGGLDSRTQAVALNHLHKEVHSYSYEFQGGYPETKIAKRIAKACDFDFQEFQIKNGYLWNCIEELAAINQCYSEFTHPRQMAVLSEMESMGDFFSLGHWGDILFDKMCEENLLENEEVELIFKKIVKKGGLELATALWKVWKLPNNFEAYLKQRIQLLMSEISITNSSAKIRAFKSLYWAPRWTSVNLSVFETKKPITLPYYDNRMCEFICTVPEQYLANRQLQIEYIKTRNREVATIKWQENRPFNLYNYSWNKTPFNLPYRIYNKVDIQLRKCFGIPYVKRNWELQFIGDKNDINLKKYLFSDEFQNLIPLEIIKQFYDHFKKDDKIKYSHSVSILLTLAMKLKL